MSIQVLLPDKPDILEPDEVYRLTGYKDAKAQMRWLKKENWKFEKNAAGKPIISRLYFQMRLSGVSPESVLKPQKMWEPNLSAAKS